MLERLPRRWELLHWLPLALLAPLGRTIGSLLYPLARERRKAAPPTVYRALEFLMGAGLVLAGVLLISRRKL